MRTQGQGSAEKEAVTDDAETGGGPLLWEGPAAAPLTVVLAHGAGAPMDSPFMDFFAGGLARAGFRVGRFEFPYMAARRADGRNRPPDPTDVLCARWRAAIAGLDPACLVIGGKSLGGRMASLIADGLRVRGLVCLGYPFHPPGRPEVLRTAHLAKLHTPALIAQGTRDPFGSQADVQKYRLSRAIHLHWLADGDHGFKPRVSSGRTEGQNLQEALAAVVSFLGGRAPQAPGPGASAGR
jgi:hypothetical protein